MNHIPARAIQKEHFTSHQVNINGEAYTLKPLTMYSNNCNINVMIALGLEFRDVEFLTYMIRFIEKGTAESYKCQEGIGFYQNYETILKDIGPAMGLNSYDSVKDYMDRLCRKEYKGKKIIQKTQPKNDNGKEIRTRDKGGRKMHIIFNWPVINLLMRDVYNTQQKDIVTILPSPGVAAKYGVDREEISAEIAQYISQYDLSPWRYELDLDDKCRYNMAILPEVNGTSGTYITAYLTQRYCKILFIPGEYGGENTSCTTPKSDTMGVHTPLVMPFETPKGGYNGCVNTHDSTDQDRADHKSSPAPAGPGTGNADSAATAAPEGQPVCSDSNIGNSDLVALMRSLRIKDTDMEAILGAYPEPQIRDCIAKMQERIGTIKSTYAYLLKSLQSYIVQDAPPPIA